MKVKFLKTIIGILFFSISAFSVFCQNSETVSSIEIKKLLPEGKIAFEVLDSVETTARQTELSYKFAEAFQENRDNFVDYLEKIGKKQKAKYPKNKFLSEKEFLECMDFAKNIKLLPSRTEIVEVIYSDDNRISFKSDGGLAEILDIFTYHAETNTFDLANHSTLEFRSVVNVEKTTNAFREAWEGYNWRYEYPEDMEEMPTKETINKMSMEQYKITLGRLSSGKTFIIISIKNFQEGSWVTNAEVTIRME